MFILHDLTQTDYRVLICGLMFSTDFCVMFALSSDEACDLASTTRKRKAVQKGAAAATSGDVWGDGEGKQNSYSFRQSTDLCVVMFAPLSEGAP